MSENNSILLDKEQKQTTAAKKQKMTDNQIRVVFYGFALFLILLMYIWRPATNKFNIIQAEKCFAAQDYLCAFKSYKAAFSSGYNNAEYIPHYVETLSKLKKVAFVQEELIKLLEYYPNNPSSADIEEIFAEIRNSISDELGNTYIEHVVLGTNVVHWNNFAGKIKVFIDKSSDAELPQYYIEEVKTAFGDYTKALENGLQFTYVNSPKEADITVYFVSDITGGACGASENCIRVLGLTETEVSGSILKSAKLQLRTTDLDGTKFTSNQIHNIAKHEIGHALGISGHSYYNEDIMYPINNDAQWAEDTPTLLIRRKDFSTSDIKTLKLLYKIIPDVTNKTYNIKAHSDMYFPIAVLGSKKEIGEKKMQEAMQYMKAVSTTFISQMNLAEGYFANRDFLNAEKAFEKALSMAKTDEEKFTIYHNLAVINYEKSDYKLAISYADIANTYSPEKESNEIKAYSLVEMDEYAKAEVILEELIKEKPDNINYSAALVGTYFKQYKFIKMFAEMKRIKEVVPDAFASPVYLPYKFFTGLV